MEHDVLEIGEWSVRLEPLATALLACSHAGARIAGFIAAAPLFPSGLVPWRFRAGFTLAVALAVGYGGLGVARGDASPVDPIAVVALPSFYLELLVEVALGLMLGWSALLVFAAARAAGSLLSDQIGFSLGAVVDPLADAGEPILRTFHGGLALFLCFALDLHQLFLRIAGESLATLPPGSLAHAIDLDRVAGFLLGAVGGMFEATLAIALPVSVVLLLVSTAQGVLTRVLPEIELFGMGFPVRVLVGLGVLIVTLPYMTELTARLFRAAAEDSGAVILRLTTG